MTVDPYVELQALPDNWDGYGAGRITNKAVEAMQSVEVEGVPSSLVPCSDGGLMRTWNLAGEFEAVILEAGPDGDLSLYIAEELTSDRPSDKAVGPKEET